MNQILHSLAYRRKANVIGVTASQLRVLEFLTDFTKEYGYPPSRREISNGLGLSSANSAQQHLDALVRRGKIELHVGIARGIKIKEVA